MSMKILTVGAGKRRDVVIGWESAASEAERLAAISNDETRKRGLQLSAAWFRKMDKMGETFPGSVGEQPEKHCG